MVNMAQSAYKKTVEGVSPAGQHCLHRDVSEGHFPRDVSRASIYPGTTAKAITQNGIKFDEKMLNTRFVHYGMPKPTPFHHIDTLQACYAAFRPTSAKLDYMTQFLGLPRKLPTEYGLWLGCQVGDKESLRKMYEYGLNDTWILEDYYAQIRAWIPKHPNFSAYTSKYVDLDAGENACPICRATLAETSLSGKPYRTPAGYLYKSGRCGNCGAVIRSHQRTGGQSIRVLRAG
jgi:hypothetical protein